MKIKKTPAGNKKLFDNHYPEILKQVEASSHKWKLYAVAWIGWDDVRQLLLIHIYQKIDQWKPDIGTLGQWLNSLIHNFLFNLRRNTYDSFKSPCIACRDCPFKNVENTVECPKYKTWTVTKKSKHDIELPVSLESHTQEVHEKPAEQLNYESLHQEIIEKIKPSLTRNEFKVYKLIYIKHHTDEEASKLLNIKALKNNKSATYKFMCATKKKIIVLAKDIVGDMGL